MTPTPITFDAWLGYRSASHDRWCPVLRRHVRAQAIERMRLWRCECGATQAYAVRKDASARVCLRCHHARMRAA